ncbi:MAG: GNAT family N-acetyltransferase [Micrococcales bacterium]|nr:GNAT family N-acetyltransferase [Micrococcales bacterium]
MELPAGYQHAALGADRVSVALEFDRVSWAMPVDDDDELPPYPVPVERSWLVEGPGGAAAAMHGSYAFRLAVPGGQVRAAGLTWVAVNPGHRRRGLLRAMMDEHLARTAARGEVVSILRAAEEPIYGRFGYGRAADQLHATVPRGAALRPVAGDQRLDVTFATASAEHADLVGTVHSAAGRTRPGWPARDLPVLRQRVLADPPGLREGAEALRLAVVRAPDGAPRAYALLRRTTVWKHENACYTVKVEEAVALDAATHHRLWSFLLDLDLTTTVETPGLACDDPLWHLLVDRRATVPRLCDSLWLRLVDLPGALCARRCATGLDVVLDVTDTLISSNHGRWRVTSAGPGTPTHVTSTDQQPDITLDVRDLASVYLGAPHLPGLADAGIVTEHTPGAVARTSTAFAWHTAPFCPWEF